MLRVELKLVGRGEVSVGFDVKAVDAGIVEHLAGGLIAIQLDQFVIGRLDRRRFAGAHDQLAAHGFRCCFVRRRERADCQSQQTQTYPHAVYCTFWSFL